MLVTNIEPGGRFAGFIFPLVLGRHDWCWRLGQTWVKIERVSIWDLCSGCKQSMTSTTLVWCWEIERLGPILELAEGSLVLGGHDWCWGLSQTFVWNERLNVLGSMMIRKTNRWLFGDLIWPRVDIWRGWLSDKESHDVKWRLPGLSYRPGWAKQVVVWFTSDDIVRGIVEVWAKHCVHVSL